MNQPIFFPGIDCSSVDRQFVTGEGDYDNIESPRTRTIGSGREYRRLAGVIVHSGKAIVCECES